jgi:SAM-dependent methyltransferase
MPEKDLKNISYYDEIAGSYDAIMEDAHSNKIVRKRVFDKFTKEVGSGARVLDFGGGTGADLEWLTGNHYTVIFCEPSTAMREQAMRRVRDKGTSVQIDFLSDAAVDFTGWPDHLPLSSPVDAILANFAVINCIRDIGLLFRSLAGVLRPGGTLMALVLRPALRHELRSLAGFATDTQEVRYKDHRQTVYMHSEKAIRRAVGPFFRISSRESLRDSEFLLIHLIRK